MKTIILAGGLGTRFSEETQTKPKPMIDIDGKPMLWHIMNIYAMQGYKDFVIATGYLSQVIDTWVKNLNNDWNVNTLFTGDKTQTGGRIRQCIETLEGERFFVTYGDGLGNINCKSLLNLHISRGRMATVTAVRPPARFGVLEISGDSVIHFGEKKQADSGWINGGFFVLEREVTKFIDDDFQPFETNVLPKLALSSQLTANLHNDFWFPMDTLREKNELEQLAQLTSPPWLNLS